MARCACEGTLPEDCNCTISSTSTVAVAGAGSSVSPFTLSPDLAASPGLLSCGADGFLGEFPARVLSPPRAKVISTIDATITTGAAVAVPHDQVVYDTDGFWNIANPTRLTNTLGITALFGIGGVSTLRLTGAAVTDDWAVELHVNGTLAASKTRRIEGVGTGSDEITDCMSIYEEIVLTAGQYVELKVLQTSATSLSARPYQHWAPALWMTYLSD